MVVGCGSSFDRQNTWFLTIPPHQGHVLRELSFWEDPEIRDGFTNMAVDDWLAEYFETPILRSYRWAPGWGSFGYFIPRAGLPPGPRHWVRRWTGGGIVDHRHDRTYTLFVPRGLELAEARGAESYRTIHVAVAAVLSEAGQAASLSGGTASAPGGECFIRPVEHDVLDGKGRKIAGAGQRRSARGLLHQGSVLADGSFDAARLAGLLAAKVRIMDLDPPSGWIEKRAAEKYRSRNWLERR
ncbi:MAG: Lipoate-protein ligase A-like protein [Akkermansiaceae bacterium]|nr:Lipoate-protein ligase A-like protein [Akkermansiaceae bacterium]